MQIREKKRKRKKRHYREKGSFTLNSDQQGLKNEAV